MTKKKLVFATGNQGKVNEFKQMLGEQYDIYSMKDLGLDIEIVEDGKTFEENAILKAEAVMKATGEMVLADDSGLVIDALNGEPGIYSARYLGHDTSYREKNGDLIRRLTGISDEQRSAIFVCAMAAVCPDGEVLTTEGAMEGRIGYEEHGENGFGYDPIFYLPERGCTAAELSLTEKNGISHRGKALRRMREKLMQIK